MLDITVRIKSSQQYKATRDYCYLWKMRWDVERGLVQTWSTCILKIYGIHVTMPKVTIGRYTFFYIYMDISYTVVWEIFGVGIFSYTKKCTKIKCSKCFLQRIIIKDKQFYGPKTMCARSKLDSWRWRSRLKKRKAMLILNYIFETQKWSFQFQGPFISATTFTSDHPGQ